MSGSMHACVHKLRTGPVLEVCASPVASMHLPGTHRNVHGVATAGGVSCATSCELRRGAWATAAGACECAPPAGSSAPALMPQRCMASPGQARQASAQLRRHQGHHSSMQPCSQRCRGRARTTTWMRWSRPCRRAMPTRCCACWTEGACACRHCTALCWAAVLGLELSALRSTMPHKRASH